MLGFGCTGENEGKIRTRPADCGQTPAGRTRYSSHRVSEGCEVAVSLAADAFRQPFGSILACTRGSTSVAHARQAAMYIAHVALGIPLIAVGRYFCRDHSTVRHACARVEDRRDDVSFDTLISELALAARIALHLDREITA